MIISIFIMSDRIGLVNATGHQRPKDHTVERADNGVACQGTGAAGAADQLVPPEAEARPNNGADQNTQDHLGTSASKLVSVRSMTLFIFSFVSATTEPEGGEKLQTHASFVWRMRSQTVTGGKCRLIAGRFGPKN
jgi:hypothetical protein